MTMILKKIPLRNLVSSAQPRPLVTQEVDKLAASIRDVGLIQPITVTPTVVVHGTAQNGWRIVAGHHRVAACRALGWDEIDAIVCEKTEHLMTELMEIDENLCRAELTAVQRTAFTKRRKQAWEALHPEELEVGQVAPPQVSSGHGGARPQSKGFAAATAEAVGQDKRTTNRAIARAEAIGDDLDKLVGTSLDKGVELDALAKMPAPERVALVQRAVAGEQVSARAITPADNDRCMRELEQSLLKCRRRIMEACDALTSEEVINAIVESEASKDYLERVAEAAKALQALSAAILKTCKQVTAP